MSNLDNYPPQIQQLAGKLTYKMLMLGFPALFERMEEGPVLRTFYYQPTEQAVYGKIMGKAEELAGALGVESVMIERDRSLISIAVPRDDRQLIRFDQCLHTMLQSPTTSNMLLPLLMGQSPNGEYLYADLADQPHMLIAGATGGGKSVYTSQLICSLALFRTPQELHFILVDTKNLDLVLFQGLEHIKSVITEVNDLRATLLAYIGEVRSRTSIMSGIARNVREWNTLGYGKPFPLKVIIIDELADVLMTDASLLKDFSAKDRPPSISSLIQQLTQISRAAGIHMIIATQRPSVKVLSGDIKANFPARVCFKLPTQTDSRVVLDENGAESLLGKGDYLYRIAGSDTVRRAHSAYVSTNDIATILAQHNEIRRMYASIG